MDKAMTPVKEEVIQMIEQLPDDAGVADIMAELYFRQKVDEGLRELDAGQGDAPRTGEGTSCQVAALTY